MTKNKPISQIISYAEMNRTPLIQKAAVIGAGSMGSGIAAQFANAGIPVLLLDVVPEGASDRSALAKDGVERQLKAGGFMHSDLSNLVETGNIEDDLSRLAEADWIVEAVFEDLKVKQLLYRKVDAVRRQGSIVSSNTSTIPLSQLIEGASKAFQRDFIITHFFNPPRHMLLLELVSSPATAIDLFARAKEIGEIVLGKNTVICRDTPGFIANRIGNYWMSVAAVEAERRKLSVEEADAVMGEPFGIPRTGIFGLFDYVGINLVPLVWGSLMRTLAPEDAHRKHDITVEPLFMDLLSRGLIGRFGPGGFYRRKAADGSRIDEVLDLPSRSYRSRAKPQFDIKARGGDLRALCESEDEAGRYAWAVLSHLIHYSAEMAPEISDDVAAIDLSMRLGYNWKLGPFQLADKVGLSWLIDRFNAQGWTVPALLTRANELGGFYPGGIPLGSDGNLYESGEEVDQLSFAAVKKAGALISGNGSASIWDLGNGVAGFEIHTKMNACDLGVVEQVEIALARIPEGFTALVIGSDNRRAFSAGAKLDVFIEHASNGNWNALEQFVARGQKAWLGLKYAPFPVIAAAGGLALGGGCELMMHSDEIVAHSELNAGFPERHVGIIPGWGGITQMLLRGYERTGKASEAAQLAFDTIARADVTSSAIIAKARGILRPKDAIAMNRDRVFTVARERAIAASRAYAPPAIVSIPTGGSEVRERLEENISILSGLEGFTETDIIIARKLAWVISGGKQSADALSEEELMRLELQAFMELMREPVTLARLEHMRATNKPLRN
ncbi:3-hydroxyacyl-CoA dehydrogenase [Tardiphaga sp. OK246]|uniref:3-hydroxyacyl-CoA dehydrogenase/enoyl-CoA hydratase family protein n=1 Tax=Tardiphaga sp. OK246 TaxID=1855307 RepID=UPI000B67AA85|nr:3-hydroxyacyl-CoA dehydrogenase NAD-binding domain-containing protein [Tardiphaga sp. OK246]SNT32794.1 3-hydroxyacyl-CoA dehydrogenase [Tardiphaga sp. OK246]